MTDLDAQVRLADLRQRVLTDQPVTPLEYRELILDLRRGRDAATAASAASKARERRATRAASKTPIDLQALFGPSAEGARSALNQGQSE